MITYKVGARYCRGTRGYSTVLVLDTDVVWGSGVHGGAAAGYQMVLRVLGSFSRHAGALSLLALCGATYLP